MSALTGIPLVQVVKGGNLALAAASSALLVRILGRGFDLNRMLALGLASVVWLHPLRIETISWASNARDCLSTFFLLLSIQAFLGQRRSWLGWALAAGLSKTAVVLIPFAFPWLAVARDSGLGPWGREGEQEAAQGRVSANDDRETADSSRPGWVGRPLDLVTWGLIAAILLGVNWRLYGPHDLGRCALGDGLWASIGPALCLQLRYFLRLFHPGASVAVPEFSPICETATGALLAVGVLALVLGLALRLRGPLAGSVQLALLWWVLAMAPVAGLVPINFPIADRYTLLASLGLAFALAPVLRRFPASRRPRTGLTFFLLACALGVASFQQADRWQSSVALWHDTARANPRNWGVHVNRAGAVGGVGDFAAAHVSLEQSWALAPDRIEVQQALLYSRSLRLGMSPASAESLRLLFLRDRHVEERLRRLLLYSDVGTRQGLVEVISRRLNWLQSGSDRRERCGDERRRRQGPPMGPTEVLPKP